MQDVSLVSEYDVWVVGRSGFVLRFNNMTHEGGVAGVGDDEKEERMIHVQAWWYTAKLSSVARCCCGLSPFFVDLKKKRKISFSSADVFICESASRSILVLLYRSSMSRQEAANYLMADGQHKFSLIVFCE